MNIARQSEPHALLAGVLAVAVHLAFFAFMYFSINWRSDSPQGMVVDIWDSLPEVQAVPSKPLPPPLPKPPPQPAVEPIKPPPTPVATRKPDIDLAEKKPVQPKPKVDKPVAPKPEVKKPAEVKPKQESKPTTATTSDTSEQEKARQAQLAAQSKLLDDYKGRIVAKVRRNITMTSSVEDSAQAEFDVTLLPGGSILNVKKTRASGNDAYDDAVERAIWKSQPLPLPPDPGMFKQFRDLHLIFTPKEMP